MSCSCCNTCGTGSGTGSIPLPDDPDLNDSILTATPMFGGIKLAWTLPSLRPEAMSKVQVFRSDSPTEGSGVLITTEGGSGYFDNDDLVVGQTYYYWIRMIAISGSEGPFIGPVSATAQDTAEQIVDKITDRITNSVLAEALRTEVSRIGLISSNLTQEVLDRESLEINLSDALAGIQNAYTGTYSAIANEQVTLTESFNSLASEINRIVAGYGDVTFATIVESYVSEADLDSAVASITANVQSNVGSQVATALEDYSTTVDMNQAISEATSAIQSTFGNQIATALQDYSTTTNIDSAIASAVSGLQSANDVNNTLATALSEYSTTVQMNQAISQATTSLQSATQVETAITNALSGYPSDTDVDTAIQNSLTDYPTNTDVSNAIGSSLLNYPNSTEMSQAIQNATDDLQDSTQVTDAINTSLANYPNTTAMNDAINSATSGLATNTQVSQSIATALVDYSTSTEMNQAISTATTTLQTEVNGTVSSIVQALGTQQQNGSILTSYLTVLDVGGYVGGFAIGNTGQTIDAIFNVDTFAIGKPGATGQTPLGFVYDSQSNAVYMQAASILNLDTNSITGLDAAFISANIQDLSVDTLKIADNAVTMTQYEEGPDMDLYADIAGSTSRNSVEPITMTVENPHDFPIEALVTITTSTNFASTMTTGYRNAIQSTNTPMVIYQQLIRDKDTPEETYVLGSSSFTESYLSRRQTSNTWTAADNISRSFRATQIITLIPGIQELTFKIGINLGLVGVAEFFSPGENGPRIRIENSTISIVGVKK